MNLIDVLKNLPPKPIANHNQDCYILLPDIIDACKVLGYDNPMYIESLLIQLANEHLIEIFYADKYDELIVGVSLK